MNGRGWKLLLVGSLVLNVFILGAIAGGAYRWFAVHGGRGAAPPQHTALRYAADDLSPERRQQFLDALKGARREGRDYVRDGREARRQVLDLLAAPQLDRGALDAALQKTRDADTALRAEVEGSVVDFAASLTTDERREFVDGLKQRGQWREPQKSAAKKPATSEASE